jgi:hypothetical protein
MEKLITLRQMKFATVKDHGHTYKFYFNHDILFEEAFKCGDSEKFWGYTGTNAESLCVEFCSIVQCLTL